MAKIDEQRLVFKSVLANYYKNERDRTERCLVDIINILSDEAMPEPVQIENILARLSGRYARTDQ